jgi:acetoin utilization deacetylase AcuC-like enzyme
VRTHWSATHRGHDPGRLPQPPGGSDNYYSEVVARGEILLTQMLEARLGPVEEVGAPDALPGAATRVHDAGLVSILRDGHRLIGAEEGRAGDPDAVVVPETIALTGPSPARSRSPWAELGRRCTDTSSPLFAGTWAAALAAARCAEAAADDLLAGARSSYALCRPPGHHAGRSCFGGFCYLNNAAVAAEHLAATGRRVAVLDVDLHHGNGTQDVFWERADVFYGSLHIDPDVDYPFYAGFADERGAGPGEGSNLNRPLPEGCEEDRYLEALDDLVRATGNFGADALVVSLGVDTHRDDPIGRFALDGDAYPRIGERLASLALPTVVVQEGGYHLPTLGRNVLGVLAALT